MAIGARPFNSPFVFPSGRVCRSFDELALACNEDWQAACNLLSDGYLESFLGGLGRIDLALTAKEASRFPDPERGLDQLLAKLPTSALPEPKLKADPLEVNLGALDDPKPRAITIDLANQGMRLLHGTATSDSLWLSLGDGPGANEKHFHFTDEGSITVTVRPDLVRAGKPAEGRIHLNTNGGSAVITFRAEKPVKPFPTGVLAGATTPREVATRAKRFIKDVAPNFENGDVERWYADNGWVYPVKVPAASGIAAIQQFFEALGLTKPPRVEINRREFSLASDPGAQHSLSLEVSTQDKRPVFAHVTSNVPWLEVGRPVFNGPSVTVPLAIPAVPNAPGQVLRGELTVISNGGARWTVPVTLEVAGAAFDFAPSPAPPPPPPPPPAPSAGGQAASVPVLSIDEPQPVKPARGKRKAGSAWLAHSLPAIALLLAVCAVVAYDRLAPRLAEGKLPSVLGPRYDPKSLADSRPRIGIRHSGNQRFGVVKVDLAAPENPAEWKKLTSHVSGETNNTRVNIAGHEYLYGELAPGRRWAPEGEPRSLPRPYHGRQATFRFSDEEVDVTQYTQVVPGPSGQLDTALVYYRAVNYGSAARKVALRFLLDTDIGGNDGAPFLVPGQTKLIDGKADLQESAIPAYLEVVERPQSPKSPGLVARLGLRGIRWSDEVKLTEPSRVVICRFPGPRAGWDWNLEEMKGDSCVAIYWPEVELKPKGGVAHFAFTYGLGELEVNEDLALSGPGAILPGEEMDVTAYVYKAKKGQEVTLDLPPGLQASEGVKRVLAKDEERAVVTWKVKGVKEGSYAIHAESNKSRSRPLRVAVKSGSIFG